MSKRLESVQYLRLNQKTDDRGWVMEILRNDQMDRSSFGQIYMTTAHPGKAKGNHYHRRKTEWFCVVKGNGRLLLEDVESKERREVRMGEDELLNVRIPPGVAHKIENIGTEMMYLLAYVDEAYSQEDPDTVAYNIES